MLERSLCQSWIRVATNAGERPKRQRARTESQLAVVWQASCRTDLGHFRRHPADRNVVVVTCGSSDDALGDHVNLLPDASESQQQVAVILKRNCLVLKPVVAGNKRPIPAFFNSPRLGDCVANAKWVVARRFHPISVDVSLRHAKRRRIYKIAR